MTETRTIPWIKQNITRDHIDRRAADGRAPIGGLTLTGTPDATDIKWPRRRGATRPSGDWEETHQGDDARSTAAIRHHRRVMAPSTIPHPMIQSRTRDINGGGSETCRSVGQRRLMSISRPSECATAGYADVARLPHSESASHAERQVDIRDRVGASIIHGHRHSSSIVRIGHPQPGSKR